MNFMDIIKGRRTIRKYKQDRIDPDILRTEYGALAPPLQIYSLLDT